MERVISSKIVFECPIFKVEEAEVELPDGKREPRWYVVKRDAVGVVAVDATGRIILLREYRSAAGEVRWRIPAGGVKDGEDIQDAARRELREEIGMDANQLSLIFIAKNPSAMMKQQTHFYLAKDVFPSPLKSDEWEEISVVTRHPEEVMNLITSGEFEGSMATALKKAIEMIRAY